MATLTFSAWGNGANRGKLRHSYQRRSLREACRCRRSRRDKNLAQRRIYIRERRQIDVGRQHVLDSEAGKQTLTSTCCGGFTAAKTSAGGGDFRACSEAHPQGRRKPTFERLLDSEEAASLLEIRRPVRLKPRSE